MVGIFVYVDGVVHGIELFKDEAISITSSVQNLNDIGKTYTDYSQSFTIPASAKNNKTFKYWFDNSLDDGFDHRVKYYGYIEIDTILFRIGKFQLVKSNKKNGAIESYTIQFVGNLTQLKDRFKDDKLNSLSYLDGNGTRVSYYDAVNHDWSLADVQNRVTNTAYDIQYPLIGSSRQFVYNSGAAAQDITQNAGAINYDELFPALSVTKILEYIQSCYGITFDSVFFDGALFSKMYLYLKNKETFSIQTEPLLIDYTSKRANVFIYDVVYNLLTSYANSFPNLNLTNNSLTVDGDYLPATAPPWFTYSLGFKYPINRVKRVVKLKVITVSTDLYNITVFNNGVFYSSFLNKIGTQTFTVFSDLLNTNPLVFTTYNFTFSISSINPVTFTTELYQEISIWNLTTPVGEPPASLFDGEGYQIQQSLAYSASQTTVGNINIKDFIPDITVESFFTGLLKAFNLVIYPTGETSFKIMPLELYYADGEIIDATQYTDSQEAEITVPKIYKRLDFKYEKSENILNNAFRGLFNLEYGNLFFENKNSTSTENYEIKLPFENIMYDRTIGSDFQTATMLNKDVQPYIPKPILMFQNGLQAVTPNIKLKSGATINSIANYVRFSNELQSVGGNPEDTQTLNFGAEISSWDLTTAFNGLYQNYYSAYIKNLFDIKTRVVKWKSIFTSYLANNIKLNDRLIIQNKRYIINNFTIDLDTKETMLELITDLRTLDAIPDALRYSNTQSLFLDNTAQSIQIQVYLKGQDLWRAKNASGFLVGSYSSGTNFYQDGLLTISVPTNATGLPREDFILLEYFKGSVSFIISIPVGQNA